MTDSDQPTSNEPRLDAERFSQQLDEWLGAHLLGPEGADYPGDTDFERMARAVESAVLAHDAAAPLRTAPQLQAAARLQAAPQLRGGSELVARSLDGARAADGNEDLDWCLAAPLPLRSGEPLNWGTEQVGPQTLGAGAHGTAAGGAGSLGGAERQPRNAQLSAGADEPSLQALADAMMANGREPQRKADREHSGTQHSGTQHSATPHSATPHSATERSGIDIAGVDRISEVKPLKGARPAAKIPQPPRARNPITPDPGRVVHLDRQGAGDARATNSPDSRDEVQTAGGLEHRAGADSVVHRASAVSDAPRAHESRQAVDGSPAKKLNWLWGAMALAAAIALGVQFGKNSGPAPVAVGNAPASEQVVIVQAAPPTESSVPKSTAPKLASSPAVAAPGEAVAVADLSALPKDGEGPGAARSHAARSAAAEPGSATGRATGSHPGAVKTGDPVLEAPSPSADSRSAGALANRDESAPGAAPAAGVGSEPEPALRPAARTSGLPPEPSVGAATGAIGVVLPSARACVAGQFEPSRANVVFGSDGRVMRVEVSGPAAGTPAEACITRVLKAARVGAFSSESFSVRTTVRP